MISHRRFLIVAAVLAIGAAFFGYRAWDPGSIRGSFDVGDRSLYLECVGEGGPTIVMETGNGGDHTAWEEVVPSVRDTNQTCTYDRANLGASDPAPTPRTSSDVVEDLHGLLTATGIPTPYVLVGHSFGGISMRLYAATYPDEVAGLVLVDPTPPQAAGEDDYAVDFSASSGDPTRWHTNFLGGDVYYPDRAEEDARLLSYTSAPLEDALRITGTPVVSLHLSSTHADGALHVYLEDVAPDGRVTYLTEGILRLIHGTSDDAVAPYEQPGPPRTFRRADAEPLTPGEVVAVEMALYATSVRVEAGHRLRIAIAGHDASTFARYPEDV